ncbi:peptidase C14 [Colletotrichum musicola]|uniref:Peptidase C14 n=1 Tax=Colletotrichum musicola TaxID=2175873 RepID=A0A8H6N7S9_9PEZI|nr:peptidase C14 [Colletotrichum musicola]
MSDAGWTSVAFLLAVVTAAYLWFRVTAAHPESLTQTTQGVSLSQVYPDKAESETDIDIIAVHGLDTKSPDTWTLWRNPEDGVNWLQDQHMLPAIAGRARIFTCDWPADLLQPSGLVQKTIDEYALLLLDGIQRRPPATSGAKGKNRPLFFIASCLGGIILAKALVYADSNPGEYRDLRRATRGIVFLATPFRGSSFKDVAAWAEPGLKAWASIRGREASRLLDSVKASTSDLEALVRRFTQLCQDKDHPCHVFTFYELGMTSLPSKVFPWLPAWLRREKRQLVNGSSATLDIVPHPLPLNRRHVLTNKFGNPECPDYLKVAGKIKKMLQKIREGSPLEQADAWIRDKHYTADRLKIERLSGDPLPMDQCYINLALVEQQSADNSKHKSGKPTPQHFPVSLSERLKLGPSHEDLRVELPKLFEPRKLPDGHTKEPRRILIRGRAGVGKTTLCKKIVHDFTHKNMWSELFSRVVWVRLRELKNWPDKDYNLGGVFEKLFFQQCPDGKSFHKELQRQIEDENPGDTLFLLDGLDEVTELAMEHRHGTPHPGHEFLKGLLNRHNVIITTRPHAALPPGFKQPDLELDTIGFNQDQVQKYIKTVMPNFKDVEAIQSYLQKNRLMQSLVQIPILLDALCFIWKTSSTQNGGPKVVPETMTAVYEGIAQNLWEKDLERLEKDGRLTGNPSRAQTQDVVSNESSTLEHLAFSGLHSDVIEFQPDHRDATYRHIKQHKQYNTKLSLHEMYGRLSFLRTSDTSADPSGQSFHFIHLTFQEYFAAKYFVQKWENNENLEYIDFKRPKRNLTKISPESFLQEHKYTVRYDIMWRFVAGLLDAAGEDQTTRFFEAIERKPVDLLGPTHQRLVMHCLSEAVSVPNEIRASREGRLTQWVLFETGFTGASTFVRESELPEQVLRKALSESQNKTILLDALGYSRRYLSETTVTALVELFEHESWHVRRSAASALGNQPSLIDKILGALGLELQSETHNRNMFRNFQYLEPLYGSLLRRSFYEGFSLYYNEDRCIINQPSGVRMAALKEDLFQSIILKGQRGVREVCPSKLWGRFEEDDS